MPIPPNLLAEAIEIIPLWSIDEETGQWIEESQASKIGNNYVGEVNHFSFWNCDIPSNLVEIEGYLHTPEGTPIANHPIKISVSSINSAIGYTNNVGFFSGKVPKDELLTLAVTSCDEIIVESDIGPFSDDTELGIVTAAILTSYTEITANLLGCIGEELPGAYGVINASQLITAENDGSITGILVGCSNTSHSVKFYDGMNIQVSDDITLDINNPNNDLGPITICNSLTEYLTFNIDGGDFYLIDAPESYIINENRIEIRASHVSNSYGIGIKVPTIIAGVIQPTVITAYSANGGGQNGQYLRCDDLSGPEGFTCDQFSVEILEVDQVGGFITGTFEGYLKNQPDGPPIDEELYVTGSFRTAITLEFDESTVRGRVWVDLNGNGTRDLDEEDPTICNINLTRTSDNSQVTFGTTQFRAIDGTYEFIGIQPGDYYLRIYTPQYELADFQVGDPTKDNDFMESTNSDNYVSYTLTITDGMIIENLDLGFKAPSNVAVNFYSTTGCAPDIELIYKITGGLKPYSIELSDGQVISSDPNDGTMTVPVGGDYLMTVTDALGNTGTKERTIQSYAIRIGGYAWVDLPGNTEGFYDTDSESELANLIIKLFDSSNILVATIENDANGTYNFDNIPYGDYYVEVEMPFGFEPAIIHSDDFYGNKINPATNRSDILSLTECNSYTRINIGLKQ